MSAVELDRLASMLDGSFKGKVERHWPLANFTTYRLGGPAALYVEPATDHDLELLGRALRALGDSAAEIPLLAVGRGSNLLVSDRGWPGVVVRMGAAFSWIAGVGERGVKAGASTPLPLLANWAARRSLAGMEFAVAIPGSVGGGVRMNAGAHGADIARHLVSVRLFDLDRFVVEDATAGNLDLGYRRSNLTPRELVIEARFFLEPDDERAIRARMESYRRHRADTQPGALQNAGSVFTNPPGDSAGRLVETAGLKGFRIGGASVSDLHANFIVADKGASAQDVYDLVHAVRQKVKDATGIVLEPEVRFVGEFNTRVLEHRAVEA